MIFIGLSTGKNVEVSPSGEEHGAGQDGKDDLGRLSGSEHLRLEGDTYQGLPPWRQVEHRFAVPCRRDVGDCQIRRHDVSGSGMESRLL